MRKECAWCRTDLGLVDSEEDDLITSGVCKPCAEKMLYERGKSLHEFLDTFKVPILLIKTGPVVYTANKYAREFLSKDFTEIEDNKHGDVIGCANADLPGGCGQTEHCKSCTIRKTVLETFETGKSLYHIKAYPDIQLLRENKNMCLEISTEKVGKAVFLRIKDTCDIVDVEPLKKI